MAKWKGTVTQLCTEELPNALASLGGLSDAVIAVLATITDSLTVEAVHRQQSHMTTLCQLQDEVLHNILKTFRISYLSELQANNPVYIKWRATEQRVLACLAAIIMLATGPCPRGFQFHSLRYDTQQGIGTRNLFFLPHGQVILGNPASKQRHRSVAPVIFAFPPSVTPFIRLYFFVLRPVGEQLLHQAALDIPGYSYLIWTNVKPKQWNGTGLSTRVQNLTMKQLDFPITPALVRQTSQAVFRTKFSHLFGQSTTSSAIRDLFINGSLQGYADKFHFPALQNMDKFDCCSNMLVNEIWQAALDLRPANSEWEQLVVGSHMFPTTCFLDIAFSRAKYAVHHFYPSNLEEPTTGFLSMHQAQQILENLPFLRGASVSLLQ